MLFSEIYANVNLVDLVHAWYFGLRKSTIIMSSAPTVQPLNQYSMTWTAGTHDCC